MSDPRRLALDPASDLEATLLRAAHARAPEEARQRALLAATAAVAASGVAAGTATAAGSMLKGLSAATLHWVGIAGIVGIGAVSATVVLTRHDVSTSRAAAPITTAPASARGQPVKRVVTATAPQVSQTTAPATSTPPSDGVALPLVPRSSASVGAEPATAPASAGTSISAELARLDQARRALSSGDAPRALSTLDDYASRFPHASMASEATVLRIEALVQAGDTPTARRLADGFLATHPQSPYADRIRTLVGPNP